MSTKDVQIRGIGAGEEQRLETEMMNVVPVLQGTPRLVGKTDVQIVQGSKWKEQLGVSHEKGVRMKVDRKIILSWSLGDGVDGQL